MPPRSRAPHQQSIAFRQRGGRRPGAGRRPLGEQAGVSHGARVALAGREPVLVTLKVRREVWSLRTRRAFARIAPAFLAANERGRARIAHFSVQRDHVHLIVEARSRADLSRGVQGLCVRIARALNRMMGRKGAVFADRYHDRVLATPRQVRHSIAYVLGNARKHGEKLASCALDPYSSAAAFDGWSGRVLVDALGRGAAALVAAPATWLLRVGWRRGGTLLDPDHRPGPVQREHSSSPSLA